MPFSRMRSMSRCSDAEAFVARSLLCDDVMPIFFSSAEAATVVQQGSEKLSPLLARANTASVFIEHICTTIWSNDVLLSKALRSYDAKQTGSVTPQHMQKALESMNGSLPEAFTPLTPTQIQQVVHSLPLDADGRINYKEFMAAFEVRDKLQEA